MSDQSGLFSGGPIPQEALGGAKKPIVSVDIGRSTWQGPAEDAPRRAEPITMTYRNYRGEIDQRTVVPSRIWFGSTDWHPEPGWLMSAYDLAKAEHRDFALADCQFADLCASGQQVRVRALEWEDFEGRGAKATALLIASYLIALWSDGRFEISVSAPGYSTGFDGERFHPTIEAAKAAAQADYERRILAALTPAPQPEADPILPWRTAFENVARMAEQGILSMDGGMAAAEIRSIAPDRTPLPAPQPEGQQVRALADLVRSHDCPTPKDHSKDRVLWNVIDMPGEYRGQIALTMEEADQCGRILAALTPAPDAPQPAGEAVPVGYRVRVRSDDGEEWEYMSTAQALDWMERENIEAQPLFAHPPQPSETVAEALKLAAARLQRLALEIPSTTSLRAEAFEWADEALRGLKGGSNG